MKASLLLNLLLGAIVSARALSRRGVIEAHPDGGFILPPGSPDGVYTINFDDDYQITNQTYKPFSTAAVNPRGVLAPREFPVNHFECGNVELRSDEWNQVWGDFTLFCDRGGGANGHEGTYLVRGYATAWICNKIDVYNPCFRSEYDNFVNFISNQCGGLREGFTDLDKWGKSYGRNDIRTPFCRR